MWIRRALLPALRPWIACAIVWTLIPVLTEMVITNLYRVPTLAEQVYLDISLGTTSWLTVVTSIVGSLVPLLIATTLLRRSLPDLSALSDRMRGHRPVIASLGKSKWWVSCFVWTVVLGLTMIPIANLLYKAGWQTLSMPGGTLSHHWSWSRFGFTLYQTLTEFTNEWQWSLTLAVGSACVALGLAILLRSVTRKTILLRTIEFVCLVLIATPGPVVGWLVTKLFLSPYLPWLGWCYDNTLLAPIVAQQARLFPLAWILTAGILASIPKQAWQLAELDNLNRIARLRYVILPTTWSMWIQSFLLLGAISVGELSTHLLLLPPGVTTLAQRLFELLHFGMRYEDSGLCLALLALGWFIVGVSWKTRFVRK